MDKNKGKLESTYMEVQEKGAVDVTRNKSAQPKLRSFKQWIREEAVFTIAATLAIVSMFFVPPDMEYTTYISYDVLAVLFCLMAVVAGFIRAGVFEYLSEKLLGASGSYRTIAAILTGVCFFGAMLVTNDVVLITFVPLTITLFGGASQKRLVFVIVMETIAANLGSMLTPIGNPQNLYLYTFFEMNIWTFLSIVFPVSLIGFILIFVALLCSRDGAMEKRHKTNPVRLQKRTLLLYGMLFVLALLTVLHVLDYRICFAVTVLVLLLFDRKLLARVDYGLLATFVAFFLFVGNVSRIEAVKDTVSMLMQGREFLTAVLASQVISNVPAAIMLSGFTDNVRELLLGVNVGGLGTLIASLASVISYKLYAGTEEARPALFLCMFTAINFAMLVFYVGVFYLLR